MFATTSFEFEGHKIVEYKGIVRGITVRSPTIGQSFAGGLKSIVGGQIEAYVEMCEQARREAFDAMLWHAKESEANAIIGVRYDTSEVTGQGASTEVLCYGTAVVVDNV